MSTSEVFPSGLTITVRPSHDAEKPYLLVKWEQPDNWQKVNQILSSNGVGSNVCMIAGLSFFESYISRPQQVLFVDYDSTRKNTFRPSILYTNSTERNFSVNLPLAIAERFCTTTRLIPAWTLLSASLQSPSTIRDSQIRKTRFTRAIPTAKRQSDQDGYQLEYVYNEHNALLPKAQSRLASKTIVDLHKEIRETNLLGALQKDIDEIPELQNFIKRNLIVNSLHSESSENLARLLIQSKEVPYIKLIHVLSPTAKQIEQLHSLEEFIQFERLESAKLVNFLTAQIDRIYSENPSFRPVYRNAILSYASEYSDKRKSEYLNVDGIQWVIDQGLSKFDKIDPRKLQSSTELMPKSSPINAEVKDNRLIAAAPVGAEPKTSWENINAIKDQLSDDCSQLIDIFKNSNVSPIFANRLNKLGSILRSDVNDPTFLTVGVHAIALEQALPSVSEEITETAGAELAAFVSSLGLFTRQFPAWRDFVNEAQIAVQVSDEAIDILFQISEIIQGQDPESIDPSVQEALSEVIYVAKGKKILINHFALSRAIGNILRAIGRWFVDIAVKANKGIKDGIASVLSGATLLGIFAGINHLLGQLGVLLPAEFGWAVAVIALLRSYLSENIN